MRSPSAIPPLNQSSKPVTYFINIPLSNQRGVPASEQAMFCAETRVANRPSRSVGAGPAKPCAVSAASRSGTRISGRVGGRSNMLANLLLHCIIEDKGPLGENPIACLNPDDHRGRSMLSHCCNEYCCYNGA